MRIIVYKIVYMRVYRTANEKKKTCLGSLVILENQTQRWRYAYDELYSFWKVGVFFCFLFLIRCMNGAIAALAQGQNNCETFNFYNDS